MSGFEESILPTPDSVRDNETVGAGLSSWAHRPDAVAKCYAPGRKLERGKSLYTSL